VLLFNTLTLPSGSRQRKPKLILTVLVRSGSDSWAEGVQRHSASARIATRRSGGWAGLGCPAGAEAKGSSPARLAQPRAGPGLRRAHCFAFPAVVLSRGRSLAVMTEQACAARGGAPLRRLVMNAIGHHGRLPAPAASRGKIRDGLGGARRVAVWIGNSRSMGDRCAGSIAVHAARNAAYVKSPRAGGAYPECRASTGLFFTAKRSAPAKLRAWLWLIGVRFLMLVCWVALAEAQGSLFMLGQRAAAQPQETGSLPSLFLK